MRDLRITLLQMDLAWENPEANRLKAESLLAPLPERGDLIVLPEMFSTGFTMKPAGKAEPMNGPTLAWMRHLSRISQAAVMGSLIVQEGMNYYNRLVLCQEGEIAFTYDKRHLFRMAGEHETYTAGDSRSTFQLHGWRILPLICYDLRFPVWSRNHLGGGAPAYDLAVYVANWPAPRVHHWKALLLARAIENQACVAGVNRTGLDGNGIPYTGDSLLLDAAGNLLAQGGDAECVLQHTLSAETLRSYREKFPAWQDADGFRIQF